MTDVSVALEALRSDAVVWDKAADSLNGPRSAVEPLGLTPVDVMCYAARRGLDRQYNDTRAKLQDLMGQAADNFRNVAAATLRKAADTYERDEEQRQHHLKRAGRR